MYFIVVFVNRELSASFRVIHTWDGLVCYVRWFHTFSLCSIPGLGYTSDPRLSQSLRQQHSIYPKAPGERHSPVRPSDLEAPSCPTRVLESCLIVSITKTYLMVICLEWLKFYNNQPFAPGDKTDWLKEEELDVLRKTIFQKWWNAHEYRWCCGFWNNTS